MVYDLYLFLHTMQGIISISCQCRMYFVDTIGRIAIQNEKNIWDESGLNLKWMTIGDRTVVDDMMGKSSRVCVYISGAADSAMTAMTLIAIFLGS